MARRKRETVDSIRSKLRIAAEQSSLSQQQIGEAMGCSPETARKVVSRLLSDNQQNDPRLSTLLAFASAIKRPLSDILS